MKIGLVLTKTPGYSETFFNLKIRGLINNGINVTLFVQKNSNTFKGCKVISAPKLYKNKGLQVLQSLKIMLTLIPHLKATLGFLKLEKQAGRSIKQQFKNLFSNAHLLRAKVDWLHFGFATNALNKENIAKSIDAKMGVSLRGFDICIYPLKNKDCYNLLWKRLDKLHVISNDLGQLAYKNGLPKNIPVIKITPAINISVFEPKTLTKNNSIINFTTVARLHWKKGLILTLEALSLLKVSGINFKYHIVGSGPQLEELTFTVFQLGLRDNVVFMGEKKQTEIVNRLNKTNIYLQYSLSEGFCNALLEAQATKCLVIGSDAEGIPENIIDGVTGFIVEKNKPKLLFQKILGVLEMNSEQLEEIKENARRRVIAEFNSDDQIKDFIKFYN